MKTAPAELIIRPDTGTLLGVADGDLWSVTADSERPMNLTAEFEPEVRAILRLRDEHRALILAVKEPRGRTSGTSWYRIVPGAAQNPIPITKPSEGATFADLVPDDSLAVLTANERDGTFVCLSSSPFDRSRQVAVWNTYLREIAEERAEILECRSLDGRPLKGLLSYRCGYQEGKRYPLVVDVYPGRTVSTPRSGNVAS